MVDSLSKFVTLEAVRSTEARYVIDFLGKVFLRYGTPDVLIADCGTAFTSGALRRFLESKGVKQSFSSTQHPQSNGQTERMNQSVVTMLRLLCTHPDKKDWSSRLEAVARHINRAPAKSTGRAPFEVLYGYLPRKDDFSLFVDSQQGSSGWQPLQSLHDEVTMAIKKAQEEYSKYYGGRRRPHATRCSIGDVVVVRRLPVATGMPTTLQKKFRGPMVITSVLPHDSHRISMLGNASYV